MKRIMGLNQRVDWLRITRNGGLYVTNRRGRSRSLFFLFYFSPKGLIFMATVLRSELSPKNKYYIDKHRYYELKHFCLQYPEWKQTYIFR